MGIVLIIVGGLALMTLFAAGFDYLSKKRQRLDTETKKKVMELEKKVNLTPWILFTIFIFGPCEPLIPLLMYPAAKSSITGVVWVAAVFGLTTILTMLSVVLISSFGISFIPLKKLERFTHAIAGATVCFCGLAIQFLGL